MLCFTRVFLRSNFPRGSPLDCSLIDVDSEVAEHFFVGLGYKLDILVWDNRLLKFFETHNLPCLLALAHQLRIGGLRDERGRDLLLNEAVQVYALEEWMSKYLVASALSTQAL